MNKDKLIEAYVNRVVDNMDIDMMTTMITEALTKEYNEYTLEEMLTEVKDKHPEVLDDLE